VIVVGGFNSSIDKLADIDRLEAGTVMRLRNVRSSPGGKGAHVALACATLGEPATLVGLIDQRHRSDFDRVLSRAGVTFAAIEIAESIRTCLALSDADGRTSELLEPGPLVPPDVAASLGGRFIAESRSADIAVLSGSLPSGVDSETYARLIRASGDLLAASLAARPFAVKPNRDEAARLVGFSVDTCGAASRAAAAIAARGPEIVIVSLGADGAVAHVAGRACRVHAPTVDVRNAVGAGDCLLAGFAVGLVRGWPLEECVRAGVACGSAKAVHPDTGILRAADVDRLLPSVAIEWV
jgi:1-phosphofructokinase family hexose kinase